MSRDTIQTILIDIIQSANINGKECDFEIMEEI